ncbi:LysE family transporter [Photorhabdus laumondii subsp. laumondii]|uniref:Photorhabdus luminescens subsp. laumondii TTO1 complete genome segment 2/17 n=3 Tax=Photorhabdus laumondii TaxID=2218628 RepID=Q7MB88_PHOLL|nr:MULTISPECIES: LysE family translocator [Photorhabdus]PQQ39007.1 LysE family translocator [Photorhabdus luminescens]AWK40557.1 lysine transporter LysE [Photorhabdus laumondii subsp. laumondii]AXG41365.1 LysE family translocator [Photorhabdus laumondii subsp. laumondii]AXG45896.1 LysE family translocator [Photorhabdus laumondii subsp. laumondii]KTL63357.1 lysine transporter LysE [Photorhabdus laumondii subsp. laumondii]
MLETSLVVIIISTLGMLSPGPDFFLVVKNAIRYQRSAAMMTVAGLIAAITCHMAYCVAGLAIVITTTPWLFNLMKYAGAAYLIWIGINSLLSRGGNSILPDNQPRQIITFKKAFMQGFLCNLLNPKATLFFLAIFTQLLNVNSGVGEKLWYASIIWGLSVIYWPILVILIQSAPVRRGLAKAQKIIDKLLGIVLIGLGVKVALG